jgi:hypothetical protein
MLPFGGKLSLHGRGSLNSDAFLEDRDVEIRCLAMQWAWLLRDSVGTLN